MAEDSDAGPAGILPTCGDRSASRSMLQTDQRFPSVSSHNKDLKVNADGSVDVYFGPTAPAGLKNNWVQTVPGKGWFVILRLYGPLKPWFDKTWRPGGIEPKQENRHTPLSPSDCGLSVAIFDHVHTSPKHGFRK